MMDPLHSWLPQALREASLRRVQRWQSLHLVSWGPGIRCSQRAVMIL